MGLVERLVRRSIGLVFKIKVATKNNQPVALRTSDMPRTAQIDRGMVIQSAGLSRRRPPKMSYPIASSDLRKAAILKPHSSRRRVRFCQTSE